MKNINEKYYIDFDKLFENFADKYYNEHKNRYDGPDDFAKDIEEVYHIWATSPQSVIGGLSPSEFFNRIPTSELLDILKGSCSEEHNPSSLLFDRIATEPELINGLVELAENSAEEKLLTVVISIINELGNAPSDFYLRMLVRTDVDSCIKDICLDEVCNRAQSLKSELLARAASARDVGELEMYAEALACCKPGDDGIAAALKRLLAEDVNVAFAAELIGRYGDDRLAEDLYPLLDTCDYVSFMEIRNAIEELGGTVDDRYRDFSDDPFYRVIKNKNNG